MIFYKPSELLDSTYVIFATDGEGKSFLADREELTDMNRVMRAGNGSYYVETRTARATTFPAAKAAGLTVRKF
jgi:hypothetical protein